MTSVAMKYAVSQWECPLAARQVKQILQDACRQGGWTLTLSNPEGHVYMQVTRAAEPFVDISSQSLNNVETTAPVLVQGETVAEVQGVGSMHTRVVLKQAVQLTAARLAGAWKMAQEIDSLASEIVHGYEELHLLYELGETLTGRLSVAVAVDLILEKILSSLRSAYAELRLPGNTSQVYVKQRDQSDQREMIRSSDEHHLGTTLRSGGRILGSIVLVRSHDDAPFSSADGKLLDAIGTLAGNAIRNAQMYEELLQQAEALQESETRLRAVMDNVAEGIVTVNEHGVVESFNGAAEQTFGYAADEMKGKHFGMLIPEEFHNEYGGDLGNYLRLGKSNLIGSQLHQTQGRRKDGTTFPMDMAVSEVSLEAQRLFIVSVRDITERKRWEEALQHQALHDALTDFPNRTLLYDRLQQAIITGHRDEKSLALLILDLDRFKDVNDTFGHQCGDLLLKEIGPRIQNVLREGDTVARLGGDEFAVLLPRADSRDAILVAHKILRTLERPFAVDAHLLDISASIGIAICPEHGQDADTLIRQADVAMYVAKRAHSEYAMYATDQDNHSASKLALMGELRSAIEQDQLVLHYQPKATLKDRRIVLVEALIRWQHPHHGLIMPLQFIPLAELTGLIRPLTKWVLNTAIRQCRSWTDAGKDIGVAVNVSAQSLHDKWLPDTIAGLLETWGVSPNKLTVEITESTLMADPEQAIEILSRLTAMGVRIAIDDFGTGYSSLAYLKRLQVDEIKIDKSFVFHITKNDNDATIVRSTIGLGHDLALTVTAEGVEDQATWDMLESMGCDIAQGYFLSKPMPMEQVIPWLNQWQ